LGDGRFSNDAASGQRAAGRRGRVGRETLDQLDDFKALPGFELEKCSQQPKALDGIARWSGEFPVKLRKKSGTFHLAPSMGSIKVKAEKGSTAGIKESLGPDGSHADLSMARLANRPADRLKVCQGTTPAASQTRPCLAGLCRPIDPAGPSGSAIKRRGLRMA
jgi:hypothetical protein